MDPYISISTKIIDYNLNSLRVNDYAIASHVENKISDFKEENIVNYKLEGSHLNKLNKEKIKSFAINNNLILLNADILDWLISNTQYIPNSWKKVNGVFLHQSSIKVCDENSIRIKNGGMNFDNKILFIGTEYFYKNYKYPTFFRFLKWSESKGWYSSIKSESYILDSDTIIPLYKI